MDKLSVMMASSRKLISQFINNLSFTCINGCEHELIYNKVKENCEYANEILGSYRTLKHTDATHLRHI